MMFHSVVGGFNYIGIMFTWTYANVSSYCWVCTSQPELPIASLWLVCCSCRVRWWSMFARYCEWCPSRANCFAMTMDRQV